MNTIRFDINQGYILSVISFIENPENDLSFDDNYLMRRCCKLGYTKIVRKLLKEYKDRSDPGPPKGNIRSSIKHACKSGHLEVIKLLLKDPRVDLNSDCIEIACQHGRSDVVELLLQDDRITNLELSDCLSTAIFYGHKKVVEHLLKSGKVDPSVNWSIDDSYNSPINNACNLGYSGIVKILLDDKRVDPSINYNTCIQQASKDGRIKIVKLLCLDDRVDKMVGLRAGVKSDQKDVTEFLSWEIIGKPFMGCRILMENVIESLPEDLIKVIQTNIIRLMLQEV